MTGGILHLVRKRIDPTAAAVIARQSRLGPVGVVLMQDGVFAEIPGAVEVYVNHEDAAARGIETAHRKVGYEEIAAFVVSASRVMVW